MMSEKNSINQDSPEWHSKLLGETEDRFNAGKEKIEDWTQAKKMLRQKFNGVKGQSPFKSAPQGPCGDTNKFNETNHLIKYRGKKLED